MLTLFLLYLFFLLAYGTVYLVRKKGGTDNGHLYAMKVLKKTNIVQKVKTAEHTKTERQVMQILKINENKMKNRIN